MSIPRRNINFNQQFANLNRKGIASNGRTGSINRLSIIAKNDKGGNYKSNTRTRVLVNLTNRVVKCNSNRKSTLTVKGKLNPYHLQK